MEKKSRDILLIIAALLLAEIFFTHKYAAHHKIMMSYWGNYAGENIVYPVPGSLNEKGEFRNNSDMQSKLNFLNILAYTFLHVNKNGMLHFNNSYVDLSFADNDFCVANKNICIDNSGKYRPKLGSFAAFARLQNDTKTLKKLISIGGADDKNSLDAAISHLPIFINSVAAIINYYHLDGVELDFEPVSFTPQQSIGYAKLIVELRKKLGSNMLIVITISSYQTIEQNSWKIIATHASFVADMCYDFHTPFYPPYYTGYNSNLYADFNEPSINNYPHMSCDQSIKRLISLRIPARKIILGYPSYALVYGAVSSKNYGLFEPFDPNQKPTFNLEIADGGSIPYKRIPKFLASGFYEHASYHNGRISGVWAYNPTTQQFLAYDNWQLVQEKVNYVNEYNLAGLMTWMIGYDLPITSEKSLLRIAKASY